MEINNMRRNSKYVLTIMLTISIVTYSIIFFLNYGQLYKQLEQKATNIYLDLSHYMELTNFYLPQYIPDSIAKHKEYYEHMYNDPFSRNHEYLLYMPVYNRKSRTIDGAIIISCGIDGIINLNRSDSLFTDDLFKKIKIYNNDYFKRIGFGPYKFKKFNISDLLNYYCGKKDLLLFYFNSYYHYKLQIFANIKNVNKVLKAFIYHKLSTVVYIKGIVEDIQLVNDKFKIQIKGDSLNFVANMVYLKNKYNVKDSIEIVGFLNEYDNKSSSVGLINCIEFKEILLNSDF